MTKDIIGEISSSVGVTLYKNPSDQTVCLFSWGRFVILNVLKEAGEDFVTLEETIDEDGKPDLLLTLDRTKIETVGVPAMGKFLEKLQVYRSIGDYESGKKLFDSYSQFDDTWLKWREIVIAKQKPKTMMIQANTLIEGIETLKIMKIQKSPGKKTHEIKEIKKFFT